jgi:hypothetical protein
LTIFLILIVASCPNSCSGRGICSTIGEIATSGTKSYVGGIAGNNKFVGMSTPSSYNLWSGDKYTKCVCDRGFAGADCSEMVCPFGDDPLTTGPLSCGGQACVDEVQGFTFAGGISNDNATYQIQFTDHFGFPWNTFIFSIRTNALNTIDMNENNLVIKRALESLPMSVTGNVTVNCGSDGTVVPNVRCTVCFRVFISTD